MIMQSASPGRVLMTADTVGGVWTYALELARALGAEGVEVALATMGRLPSSEQQRDARAIGSLQLYQSAFRLPWMEQPWEDVHQAGEWLLELVEEVSPSLVHLNEPVHGSLPWPVPCLAVSHSCVLSWWESVWNCPAPPEWEGYRHAMTRGLELADEIIAPSDWMLWSLQRHYGISKGRVIPNGRDSAGLTPSEKSPVIFAAGRLWDPAKNLVALDAVASDLRWPIYVAGEATHPQGAEPVSAKHVRLLGQLSSSAVADWLRRASVYVLPARYEPFGLSVLEAALAGCALVLGDLPPLRQLWEGAAIFVPSNEPRTLRVAIDGLIEDPTLRHALAMRARKRALSLTPRRMALAYLEVYAGMLTSSKSWVGEPTCTS